MHIPHHVYVHVPFCRAKCEYCGFFSLPAAPGAPVLDEYVEAVTAEWRRVRSRYATGRVRTVFLGGGTPSLLGPERLERLLGTCAEALTRRPEISIETNPEDVDAAYPAWAAKRGLRVSLGVQSFSAATRHALGRSTEADPAAAYERLRRAGCRSIGLDLIFGAPGQRLGDVDRDLECVVDLRPDHVSWYELELTQGTPLARRASGDEGRGHADQRAEMFRRIVRVLGRAGYDWYEVSNFARPRHRCRHNSAIWRGEDYVGLGPGAVGTIGDARRHNLPDLSGYLAALGAGTDPPHTLERLGACTRMRERVYLASRVGAPVPLADVHPVVDDSESARLARAGLVSRAGGTLRVTRKGRYVADEVCVRLFRDFCVEGQD